jgi:hypothetical protein
MSGSEEVWRCRKVEVDREGAERGVDEEVAGSGTCKVDLSGDTGPSLPCTGWLGTIVIDCKYQLGGERKVLISHRRLDDLVPAIRYMAIAEKPSCQTGNYTLVNFESHVAVSKYLVLRPEGYAQGLVVCP